MASVYQIKGVCSLHKPSVNCIGTITILHRTGKTVYAGWEMHIEDGKSLVGKSRNYFMDKENAAEEEVIPFILENIKRYRIGRERIFTAVQIIKE